MSGPSDLADELQRIYASDSWQRNTVPVAGIVHGRRVVTEVPHERITMASIVATIEAIKATEPPPVLRVTTSRFLKIGQAWAMPAAGAVIVGVEPLDRMERLLAEARNDARAIVRRNLAAEIEWCGLTVRDEPTTPEEAVAFWTGRDEGTAL